MNLLRSQRSLSSNYQYNLALTLQETTLTKLHEFFKLGSDLGSNRPLLFLSAIAGFSLILTSAKPAAAAGIIGNGTAGSCTESALTAALVGGGTVSFNCGSSPVTIRVSSEKLIAANTLIDGQNLVTFDGGGKNRIFKTLGNGIQLTVRNSTIANGFTTDEGGGIYNGYRGKLAVINCKFTNNVSTRGGEFDGGGAIYTQSESTVFVDKSTFTGNKAGNGGAINNLLSNLTVTNSTFSGNQSTVSGSGGGGGAIYYDGGNGDSGKIVLRNNTFTNNTAVFQGGAVFSQLYKNNTSAIENSTFSGNKVTGTGNQGFGAAIFNSGGASTVLLTVSNSTFTGNMASNQGGAVSNANSARLNIINSTFSGNRAESGDGKGGLGGAIMRTNGKITITNSTIADNYAGFQGGGIVGDGNVTLKNTIIANNRANNGGNNWNIKHNCFSAMTNGGNNLQFPANNSNDPNDPACTSGITTADPLLGALTNNGGATQTRALLTGSPAINKGNNNTCPTIDQRGVTRPQGGTCDIGAFEVK